MQPRFKRIAAVGILIITLLVMLGVAGLFVFVNSHTFRQLVVTQLNQAIPGTVSVTDLFISPLNGSVEVKDIALTQPDGSPVATIKRLQLKLFWPALLWRTVHLSSMTIEQPTIWLVYDAQQRLNLLQTVSSPEKDLPPESRQSGAWNVRLARLSLTQGSIDFRQPAVETHFQAGDITIQGHGDLIQQKAGLKIAIGRMALQTPEIRNTVEQIRLTATYDRAEARPIVLALQTPQSQITVHGTVDGTKAALQLNLNAKLDVALSEVQDWLPPNFGLAGRINGILSLQGPLDVPQAIAKVTVSDGQALGVPAMQAVVEARLAQHQLTIASMQMNSSWADLDLDGQFDVRSLFVPHDGRTPQDSARAPFAIHIDGRKIDLKQLPIAGLPAGTWQGQIQASGDNWLDLLAGGKAEADLQVKGLQMTATTTPTRGQLVIRAGWDRQKVSVEALQADLAGSDLQAQGSYHWNGGTITVRGNVHSAQLIKLGEVFGVPLPRGSSTLKFDASGEWHRPAVQMTLTADQTGMAQWTFGQLFAQAELDEKGHLAVSKLVITNGAGSTEGHASLALRDSHGRFSAEPALEAVFDLNGMRLSDFNANLPVDTVISGRLNVHGSVIQPVAELKLSKSLVEWQNKTIEGWGEATWDNGTLAVSALHLNRQHSTIDLKGRSRWRNADATWTSDAFLQVTALGEQVELEDIWPDANAGGKIDFQFDLHGPVSALAGQFHLAGNALRVPQQTIEKVRVEGHLAENTVYMDQLQLMLAPEQSITATGWYAFDQRFQAELSASNLDLRHIDGLQKAYPVTGLMNVDFKAAGSLKDPQLNGNLIVHSPKINEQPFDDFNVQVNLTEHRLAVNALLTFRLVGHYYLDSGHFEVTGHFDQTDLDPYLAIGLGSDWHGRLDGTLTASGNRFEINTIMAQVALTEAVLSYESMDLLNVGSLKATLDRGVLNLPPTRVALLRQGYLDLQAHGRIDQSTEFFADGQVPMSIVEPFTDRFDRATGEIELHVKGRGPLAQMQWQGDMKLKDAGGLFVDIGQRIHHLNGNIKVTPQNFTIETLTGKLDDGPFKLEGSVQMADFRPDRFDFRLNAFSLPLQVPDTLEAHVMVDLMLKGDLEKSLLSGNLLLLEGLYYKNVRYNLFSIISQPQRKRRVEPTRAPAPWMRKVRLNVDVTDRYPFLVDNNVAQVSVVPDLKIKGTLAEPLINGRTHISEGEVFFRGKSFEVKRGVVDFVNPYKTEPILDIQAETQIREWQIVLTAEGPLDRLLVKLSSEDGSLSDNNILSLILLGRTSEELSEGSGTATPGQMLAALVTSTWGEDIKKSTGVDILELQTGATSEDESADRMQLTVGKELTRRLTVKYELESGGDQVVHRAVSEYRLLEHLLASGFRDTRGMYGGELVFRVELR